MSAKVSIIVPSRNERFLAQTIENLLAAATGDVEVIAVLDGYWPDPQLPEDKRLIQLHRGQWKGMRPGINAAAGCARGDYLMKIDGHCSVPRGFDEILVADCADNWIVVPRRYSLDPEAWEIKHDRPIVDAHYLSWPYARPDDHACGLHGNIWTARGQEREDVLIDDEMSSQGSCWFMSRKHWDRTIGPMEIENYGTFAQEFQELGLKTWLGGGEVKVNKRTWYAHLHKGKTYGTGYGFSNKQWAAWKEEKEKSRLFTIDHWMHDRWPERAHDLQWLIDRFWPVPGWPEDWRAQRDNA